MKRGQYLNDSELAAFAEKYRRERGHGGLAALFRGKPLRRIQFALQAGRYSYPHRNLFIAGCRKSGTTWLERMLVSVPGYRKWVPGYIPHTRNDLLPNTLNSPPPGYTVTRVHTRPLDRNVNIVHELGRPYLIIYRDPRDILVSDYYYGRNTPRLLYHEKAKSLDLAAWIHDYIDTRLDETLDWCVGWVEKRDPERGAVLRYEETLADTQAAFTRVLEHFGIELPPEQIAAIVDAHTFEKATGRKRGEEDPRSFNRKGIAGDWANHFTAEHIEHFRSKAGDRLERIGYSWIADATD